MQKIAIVTDSTSDLENEQLKEYGISVLPLKIIYTDREFTDRVDITPEEVYRNLEKEVPKTSLPSPSDAFQLFEHLKNTGFTHVLCIHISSGLSGTIQMVRNAAAEFNGIVIKVLDSKSLSMGLGFPVLEAAKEVSKGSSFDEVVNRAEEVIDRVQTFFVVGTLEYLKRGGRIGYVSASLGEILQVKPIISINDEGKYYTHEKTRGRKKSLNRMLEIIRQAAEGRTVKIAVFHGDAQQEADFLIAQLKTLDNVEEIVTGQIGPVMVVHTGPGLVGVVIY